MISQTAIIHPYVELGENVLIEDFCIIGVPIKQHPQMPTIIGDNCVIRSHTVIYAGNIIGSNFSSGNKANIRENNLIGDNVSIGTLSIVEHHCKIGHNVRIHSQAFIPEFSELQNDCWIGPKVVLTNSKYPKSLNSKDNLTGPIIEEGAIIGANATILPGIRIGARSLIAAGSVVAKDTKSNSLYKGFPAKFVKYISEIKDYDEYFAE